MDYKKLYDIALKEIVFLSNCDNCRIKTSCDKFYRTGDIESCEEMIDRYLKRTYRKSEMSKDNIVSK